jgi:ketosteroid isomerase-like protein
MPLRDPTEGRQAVSRADDFEAIRALICRYSTLVDSGDVAGLGELFAHGRFLVPGTGTHAEGRAEAERIFRRSLKYHDDGTPQTMHFVGNVVIDLDEEGRFATSTSYTTVFQGTKTLPLQVILTASYADRFEQADGGWRFVERIVTFIHKGDTSEHFVHPLSGFRIPRPVR